MIYSTLAPYYDQLVKDDEATAAWVRFTKRHLSGSRILELACGSGEITIALAQQGYQITGTDLSEAMIEAAKQKTGASAVAWRVLDMLNLDEHDAYDAVICYCDSLNYLADLNQLRSVLQAAYDALHQKGTLLFDIHSLDRLQEFAEEYIEEGYLDDTAYQWTIRTEDDWLLHCFIFYDRQGRMEQEQHQQRVFDPFVVADLLKTIGFRVHMYTDFDQDGICPGEKIFFVAVKEETV